jgi:hypothetical protein
MHADEVLIVRASAVLRRENLGLHAVKAAVEAGTETGRNIGTSARTAVHRTGKLPVREAVKFTGGTMCSV